MPLLIGLQGRLDLLLHGQRRGLARKLSNQIAFVVNEELWEEMISLVEMKKTFQFRRAKKDRRVPWHAANRC